MRTETSDEPGWFCWVSQHSVSSPRLFSIYVDDSQGESQSHCWQDFGSQDIASVTHTRNRLLRALNLLCTWSWCSRVFLMSTKERPSYWCGRLIFTHFQCERICWKWVTPGRTKWERETWGRIQIVVQRCFCSRKEGEVTSGGRWPVREEANLPPPMKPSWESAHTAPALRRDPEIIQRLGKTFHKRKLGGELITMSHMEKLGWFHSWK